MISDNLVGVRIGGIGETKANVVSGNLIGTDATGASEPRQPERRRAPVRGRRDNTIGGTGKGEGNLMRFTPGGAISVGGGDTAVRQLVPAQLGLRQRRGGDRPRRERASRRTTSARRRDTDTGPNHLQNFPVLIGGDEQTDTIFGDLDSTPQSRVPDRVLRLRPSRRREALRRAQDDQDQSPTATGTSPSTSPEEPPGRRLRHRDRHGARRRRPRRHVRALRRRRHQRRPLRQSAGAAGR